VAVLAGKPSIARDIAKVLGATTKGEGFRDHLDGAAPGAERALPGDRVPLAERSDVDQALLDCRDLLMRAVTVTSGLAVHRSRVLQHPVLALTLEFTPPTMPNPGQFVNQPASPHPTQGV
jgi:hypothetical protein